MGPDGVDKRLRVGGDVELTPSPAKDATCTLSWSRKKDGVKRRLNVIYNGADPLPDTFKDNAPCQALVDGPSSVPTMCSVPVSCRRSALRSMKPSRWRL